MIGIGDEILASGEARRAQLTDPRRVQILDRTGAARWHPIWEGNPRIARPGEQGDFQRITNGPGARPYIVSKTMERWTWRAHECTPGEIVLTASEREFARPHHPQIVIEPTIKSEASPNKNWGIERWRRLVHLMLKSGLSVWQLRPPGTRAIDGAKVIPTPDFRRACAVLANARAYVGHEGGLHHAAAALGVPAVVIFGGFIGPAQTGYAAHRNLFTGGQPCGMRVQCNHCAVAMLAITPDMVLDELRAIL